MRADNTPTTDFRYWIAISIASVFGANLGDFVAKILHLGHWQGLPPLALLMVAVLLAERRSKWTTEAFYWGAILLVRTAATNIGDLGRHEFGLSFTVYGIGLAAALAAAVWFGGKASGPREGMPATGNLYWATMLIAGTLGTVWGDAADHTVGLPLSTVITCIVLAATIALRLRPAFSAAAYYWVAIVVVRTAGTNMGDLLAHNIGLVWSTVLSGGVLVAALLLWQARREPVFSEA